MAEIEKIIVFFAVFISALFLIKECYLAIKNLTKSENGCNSCGCSGDQSKNDKES